MLVVRRIEVEYVAPARLDECLVVETQIRRFGGASVDLTQDILDEAGRPKARMVVDLVCVRVGGVRPVPLPEPWRSCIKAGVRV